MRRKTPPYSTALGEFAWAMTSWVFSALIYNYISKMERIDSQPQLRSFVSIGYNLGGKWGAILPFIAFGGACFWAGINKMKKRR
jgi:hypothetical protein